MTSVKLCEYDPAFIIKVYLLLIQIGRFSHQTPNMHAMVLLTTPLPTCRCERGRLAYRATTTYLPDQRVSVWRSLWRIVPSRRLGKPTDDNPTKSTKSCPRRKCVAEKCTNNVERRNFRCFSAATTRNNSSPPQCAALLWNRGDLLTICTSADRPAA